MKKNYKLSILIPVYNAENYISETIGSALSQTWQSKEIIVVDDGSTDQSFEIAKSFESDIVKVYKLEHRGACVARNRAFELSNGAFIQYLDGDDLLSAEKIEKQIYALIGKNRHVAVCNTWNFIGDISKAFNTDQPFLYSTDDPAEFLINLWGGYGHSNYVALHNWLTPRQLIEKTGLWNEELLKDQDGEFFTRVLLNSAGIIYVPDIKTYYRKYYTGDNIGSKIHKIHIESNLKAMAIKGNLLLETIKTPAAYLAVATQYKYLSMLAYPQAKELSAFALNKCKLLGDSYYNPELGGQVIEFIKKMFGWKTAKVISYYAHNLKWLIVMKQNISKMLRLLLI